MLSWKVLKNKVQPSKSEALIGFIIRFMNQAASHPATEWELWWVVQKKVFVGRKGGWNYNKVSY